MRVCSEWNILASPFLYERIIISRVDQLRKLVRGLSARRGSPQYNGSHVTRLDIDLRWSGGAASTPEDQCLDQILRLCTRLVTLNASSLGGISFDYFNRISSSIPADVEHLYWCSTMVSTASGMVSALTPLGWRQFLQAHPHLKFVDLKSGPRMNTVFDLETLKGLTWPSMEVLMLHSQEYWNFLLLLDPGAFPNLQQIVIRGAAGDIGCLLKLHGRPLRAMHLPMQWSQASNPHWLVALFNDLNQYCPNLQELGWMWYPSRLDQFHQFKAAGIESFPDIHTLVADINVQQLTKQLCVAFLDANYSWIGNEQMPNLQTVRFSSEAIVEHLQTKHAPRLRKFLDMCAVAGVRVEDPFHRPLNIPSRQ